MKSRIPLLIGILALSAVLVGCHSTKAIITGTQRAPISVTQVKVYDAIPFGSEPVGILMAKASGKSQGSIDAAMKRLKEKAASLGANGIVINDVGTSTVFINYWPVDETQVSAKAFYR
jgi:hypothetical protein